MGVTTLRAPPQEWLRHNTYRHRQHHPHHQLFVNSHTKIIGIAMRFEKAMNDMYVYIKIYRTVLFARGRPVQIISPLPVMIDKLFNQLFNRTNLPPPGIHPSSKVQGGSPQAPYMTS